jgi:acetoin utilization protein AcuC
VEKKMMLAVLYREELREYNFGSGHPFQGDRFEVFSRFLKEKVSEEDYRFLKGEWASDEDLSLISQKDYINFTREYYGATNLRLRYDGNFFRYHSVDNRPIGKTGKLEEAARLIVGQAKMAADLILSKKHEKVVSIGGGLHHAKPGYGEGFCIYNDVAFVAKYLIEKHNLEKVLILDTDAHAGNGTSEYFYSDPKVLFIDLHQNPRTLYPGTGFADQIGRGEGEGYTINVPLPIYAGDDSYQIVFEEVVQPVSEEFEPEIIIRNGGSDPHFADELTNLGLTVKGFNTIGRKVRKMSTICGGRVIDLIASGYNKEVLPYCWLALITGLSDLKISIREPKPIHEMFNKDTSVEKTLRVIEEVKENLKDHWSCMN